LQPVTRETTERYPAGRNIIAARDAVGLVEQRENTHTQGFRNRYLIQRFNQTAIKCFDTTRAMKSPSYKKNYSRRVAISHSVNQEGQQSLQLRPVT
jgi:hypothetical protein